MLRGRVNHRGRRSRSRMLPGGRCMAKAIEPRRLRSHDGTRLTYYAGGAGEGVALVFCGGLGGGIQVWQPLLERFAPRFRLLAWDYRGLYASGPSPRRAYGIEDHARDLRQLLEHEGVEAPVLLGWSMGVQVMLEAHRADPALARGLVAIHGTPGRPLQTGPSYLVFDRDSIFSESVISAIRAMGVEPKRIASRSPWQNGVAERWIGSCRRELLDRVVILHEAHLRRLLREYVRYYSEERCHLGPEKDAPDTRSVQSRPSAQGRVVAHRRLGGLHHRYAWREAA